MSHKKAKAKRKAMHAINPLIKGMPKSITESTFTGRFQGITAAGLNAFREVNKYDAIATEVLTAECRKYWYKLA